MPKLVLLKKPRDGVSRDELIEYLKTEHGPHNAQLPGVDYTLSVQVDPDEDDAVPDDAEYYDSHELIPLDPDACEYDTLEIHEFDTIEELIEAHSSDHAEEAENRLHEFCDIEEDEIAFVARDACIED